MSAVNIRRLDGNDNCSTFDCGKKPLDDYLRNDALAALKANGTVTWVLLDEGKIIGYYSSVFGSMRQEEAPKQAKGAVHPYDVPMFKIARLAVDKSHQGKGLGAALVLHALTEAVAASERAGLRMVTLDAIEPDLMRFYEKFGFKCYDKRTSSMFVLIKNVKRTLSQQI